MDTPLVSRKGVYYDLTISPYVYEAYGENFRFSSLKKMEIFKRELPLRIARLEKAFQWLNDITNFGLTVDLVYCLVTAEKLYADVNRGVEFGRKKARFKKSSAQR